MTEVNLPGDARGLMIAVAEGDDASAAAIMSAYITELPTVDRLNLVGLVFQLADEAVSALGLPLNSGQLADSDPVGRSVAEFLRRELQDGELHRRRRAPA